MESNVSNNDDGKHTENDWQAQLEHLLRHAQAQFLDPEDGRRTAAGKEEEDDESARKHREAIDRIRHFSLRPREIRDYLDRFVVRQDEAKKVLSVAVCDHFNHVRRCLEDPRAAGRYYAKQNVLLMGPTGVGKTYLIRTLARMIGVPFVKADATKFSETGYVGYDVEDLVRDLVKMAGGDIEVAQYGMIYIDEIDKIASRSTSGRDVSGRGVQVNLLKLMEETEANLFSQTDLIGQMQAVMDLQRGRSTPRTINTRHMLFIVSGAFDDLPDIVRSRVEQAKIGFAPDGREDEKKPGDYLDQAQAADFISFGFEPEFIGRLPVRVPCEALDVDDLERILLQSEDSLLRQYREDFEGYGITFDLQPEAIRDIARRAHEEKTGARGLMTVLERVFREYKFLLPSTSIRAFQVTTETLAHPAAALAEIQREGEAARRERLREDVCSFGERFRAQHGIKLLFDEEAMDALVDLSISKNRTMRALCEDLFKDFEYGLKLVAAHDGATCFRITRDVVERPGEELSRWVVSRFRDTLADRA